jgi:preprotein translocase subunit SecF
MNRTKGILAAGTLTGLVIITLLGLGFSDVGAAKDSVGGTAVPQEVIPQEPQITTTDPTAQEAVQAWQAYSAELEQTVRVLQERENAYQSQMDAANQTIVNLQDQVNSANSAASSTVSSSGGEHEEHEHEAHERFEDDD